MAAISMVMGGSMGFVAALVALVLGASLMAAAVIWTISGLGLAGLALVGATLTGRQKARELTPAHG